jgi:uncharacterized membrane protein
VIPRNARPAARRLRPSRSAAAIATRTSASVDPLSVADLHRHAAAEEKTEAAKKTVIALFVLSIVGFFAPVMLIVSLIYVWRQRALLAKCGPLFAIMGWASVVLSMFYSLLMVLFVVGEALVS